MRADEVFASDCVSTYLGGNTSYKSVIKDPPDCIFNFSKKEIAAEVTQLRPITILADGAVENRSTQDSHIHNLCDELDQTHGKNIEAGLCVCLYIVGPIHNPRKFKRNINSKISDTNKVSENRS